MRRALRIAAVVLLLLAVIGVFNTPLTGSKVAYADGGAPIIFCDPSDPTCVLPGQPPKPGPKPKTGSVRQATSVHQAK